MTDRIVSRPAPCCFVSRAGSRPDSWYPAWLPMRLVLTEILGALRVTRRDRPGADARLGRGWLEVLDALQGPGVDDTRIGPSATQKHGPDFDHGAGIYDRDDS